MASKFILIHYQDRLTSRQIKTRARKPYGLTEWLACAKETALAWGRTHYAFRFEGRWYVVATWSNEVVRSFPAANGKAAVEMYLVHCGTVNC